MTRPADATMSKEPGTQLVAWQGWRLTVPESWNPVRLEGDHNEGSLLLSDLTTPKLALRWRQPGGKRFDEDRWAQRAMVDEVGQLAADEATSWPKSERWSVGRLYVEPDPPGRDVFVARSGVTGRLLQVVYHAARRDRVLSDRVVPGIADTPADAPQPWSVFELSCVVPAGWALRSHRLNAGDLRLGFARRRGTLAVRQIAVAELALKRLSLDRWLGTQQYESRRHYRPRGEPAPTTLQLPDGRELAGLRRTMVRRWRWSYQWWRPVQVLTIAVHDTKRDRLLIGEGDDEDAVRQVLASVGQFTAC
jgi:hypothetical protein